MAIVKPRHRTTVITDCSRFTVLKISWQIVTQKMAAVRPIAVIDITRARISTLHFPKTPRILFKRT